MPGRDPRFDPVSLGRMGHDARSDCLERVECGVLWAAVSDDEVEPALAIDACGGGGQGGGLASLEVRNLGLLGEHQDRGRDVEVGEERGPRRRGTARTENPRHEDRGQSLEETVAQGLGAVVDRAQGCLGRRGEEGWPGENVKRWGSQGRVWRRGTRNPVLARYSW